ncbi:MAG: hypothetical protein OSB62_01795 [Alphaproteobacteria bacterium]|nr:hypothetical protein [Alphaproteobacteria bacterium]
MTVIDTYTRAVIQNLINSANFLPHSLGIHQFGLYEVENLFKLNLALHLEAARTNRYANQMYSPAPAVIYTCPYVYFCYIGMGTLELIQLHEYDPVISIDAIEKMIATGELTHGEKISAPPPYQGVSMTQIIIPN